MQGLMMDYPLTLQHFYNRAVRLFPRKEGAGENPEAVIRRGAPIAHELRLARKRARA